MIELTRRIAAHCDRHGLLPPGRPLLAMVSGGPDSTCMLHALAALHDGPLGVLGIDHGLRPAAAAEIDAVAAMAATLGATMHRVRLDIHDGPALQERAREARRRSAEEVAARHGYARIALGHTADDQAETVLFRLARGTGPDGAAGMAALRDPWIRPLLGISRADAAGWCAAAGVPVADDPSNRDPRFARARVRHGLLPSLRAVHPDAARHVASFAELVADERAVLEAALGDAWERCAAPGGLSADALAAEPVAMRRMLVRRLLERAGLPAAAGERAQVERVLAVAGGGGRVSLPGGGSAALERGVLVAPPAAAAPPGEASLPVPGTARFGAVSVEAATGIAAAPRPDRVAVAVDGPLQVRAPRPGDRLAIAGVGRRRIGRLLADAGVPARLRPGVPVVADGERVVWVVGHRAADDLVAPTGATATVLSAAPAGGKGAA